MFAKPIQQLVDFFLKFPGVGPKQAGRFAFYLLREDQNTVRALAEALMKLHDEVQVCGRCYKTFNGSTDSPRAAAAKLCEFCRNVRRNASQVLVVEKEVDLEAIERSRTYAGLYHVLGGIVSPLDSSAPVRLHLKELFERVRTLALAGAIEVILGTNPTAEGEATALYIERILAPLRNQHPSLGISRLGRGISTGSELEYTDEPTIIHALENRK